MDKSQSLLAPMRRLYFRQIRQFMQTGLLQPLQERLTRSGGARSESYDDLKSYLLLTAELPRLKEDEKNQQFLSQHLAKVVEAKDAPLMRPHLDYFARTFSDAVADSLAQPLAADMRVIAQARSVAGKLDVPGIYENLKRKVAEIPAYTASAQVFIGGSQVRGTFTSEGYKALDQLIESSEFMNLGDEAKWVLGLEANQMQGTLRNPSQIGDSLRGTYLREYAAEWSGYLTGLRIAPFENLSDAANRMRQYADARSSPIKLLLKDAVANTTFESALKKGLQEKTGKLGAAILPSNYVESEFSDVHRFAQSDPDNGKPGEIDGLLGQLG
jgi:type VI protein secretion system component VasK